MEDHRINVTTDDTEPLAAANGTEAPDVPADAPRGEAAEDEAQKYRDMYLRSQAEMDNMRKRLQRELEDFRKYANESILKDLLQVVDNLERALGAASAPGGEASGLAEGVRLTLEGLLSLLDRYNVKPVSAMGERFDPHYHEAIMQQESADAEDNTVLQEVQKGWLLGERLLRPSMVIVSRRPAGGEGVSA